MEIISKITFFTLKRPFTQGVSESGCKDTHLFITNQESSTNIF
jgi:hypothetical protein